MARHPKTEAQLAKDRSVGAAIKHIRESRGMRQKDVAESISLPRESVAKMERGATHATDERLAKIADTLGVTVEEVQKLAEKLEGTPVVGRVTVPMTAPAPEAQGLEDGEPAKGALRKVTEADRFEAVHEFILQVRPRSYRDLVDALIQGGHSKIMAFVAQNTAHFDAYIWDCRVDGYREEE